MKTTVGRILIVMTLGAGLMAGGETESRGGVWKATFERSGKQEHLLLVLQIFNGGIGTPTARTGIDGSVYLETTFDGRVYWNLDRSCGFLSEPKIQLVGDHLVFRCSNAILPETPDRQPTEVFEFDGRFDQSFTRLSGTLRQSGREIQLSFMRPEESKISPLAGHWIASGSGQTCVLHVYEEKATIDIYSNQQASFGQIVGVAAMPDGTFHVRWDGIGPSVFIGSVDVERKNFEGSWYGRGFHCSENGPQGHFIRLKTE